MLAISLPINPRTVTLSSSYGTTDSDVIDEPPFDRFDITGNSRYYKLTLCQPVFQTPNQEFTFGLTASCQESDIKSLLETFEIPDSELLP